MKARSQAQRDAQLNAMEAARGAAARRAEEKRAAQRADDADQSRLELTAPRRPDPFGEWKVRLTDRDGSTKRSWTFRSEDDAQLCIEHERFWARRGVWVWNWDAYDFEPVPESV